jgi:hypothetical protein
MAWEDWNEVTGELQAALDTFEWSEVSAICGRLAQRIDGAADLLPLDKARRLLSALRRKRRFAEMKQIAEALVQSGQDDAEVIRQYAQALIDSGELAPAKRLLDDLLADAHTPEEERHEAVGLLGRLHKQLYVNAQSPGSARQQDNLRTSINRYYQAYCDRPEKNLWHGINVVALLYRAKRDGVAIPGTPDEAELARTILRVGAHATDPWSVAIRMEANVALRDWKAALAAVDQYVSDKTLDAFEFASTLRQLQEVWQLSTNDEPEGRLLDTLRSALALRIGGEVVLSREDVGLRRQANFDAERHLPLGWWQLGLSRCASVARIENTAGIKVGSGFLVEAADFLKPDHGIAGPLLLTNWHVISRDGVFPGSIAPEVARARFEASGQTVEVGQIVACHAALDACFVSLRAPLAPPVAACPVCPPPPVVFEKGRRVYVIGYPSGGDLSFSVHDSFWLGMDDTRFHYRTPTEPGSSGSPVFDQQDWRVVALHRAGGSRVPRLTGIGTYEANEGTSIAAIQKAVREKLIG